MAPSELAKKGIEDLNFDFLVASVGINEEAEQAKKAARQKKTKRR